MRELNVESMDSSGIFPFSSGLYVLRIVRRVYCRCERRKHEKDSRIRLEGADKMEKCKKRGMFAIRGNVGISLQECLNSCLLFLSKGDAYCRRSLSPDLLP